MSNPDKPPEGEEVKPILSTDPPSYEELFILGHNHYVLFRKNGGLDDMTKAIEYGTRALNMTPEDHSDFPPQLNYLAIYCRERFQRLGELGDLETGIEYGTRALNLTPNDHSDLPTRLNNLGMSHRDRFQRLGKLEDLAKAIEYGTRAVDLTPEGQALLPFWLTNLGMHYSDRFRRLGEPNDLEKAIELETRALSSTPDGHSEAPIRLHNLGISHRDRFQHLGKLDDLEKAIEYGNRALSLTPDGDPQLPSHFANLGTSYSHRFRRLGELEDLKMAIEHRAQALALTPDNHPYVPTWLNDLGASYYDRFQRLGDVKDIEKAIEHKTRALGLTPDGHPNLPLWCANLGTSYSYRFRRLGELNDIEKAIELESRALALTPDSHPDLPTRLGNLGLSYHYRFQRLGKMDDLEQAIKYKSRALDLTPNDHPDLPNRLNNLWLSYHDRFGRLGEMDDLAKLIQYGTRAVNMTPDSQPYLPVWLSNLGSSYSDRYGRLGELEDLEKAIELKSRALSLAPDDHPELPAYLANLGWAYASRFRRLGELNDIEKAIELGSRALNLTPDGHPDVPLRLHNLISSYDSRFQSLGELNDLEKSIEYGTRAVDLTPDDHPQLPIHLDILGKFYHNRFEGRSQPDDLGKAITLQSRAVALSTDNHPALPMRYANLASSYADRFRILGSIADLEKATKNITCALASTPDEHPFLNEVYFYRGKTSFYQYQRTADLSHLNDSLDSFRKASQLQTGSPRTRFRRASFWAKYASQYSELNPTEAYQTTIDLLPQFIWLGATTSQRYQDLSTIENLAINAAYASTLNRDYRKALEWLEHARCVVWSQSLMLRSPLDQLYSSHPGLAASLQTVAARLQEEVSASRALVTSDNLERVGRQRRELAEKYNSLLLKARTLPGFGDFLQPMKANGLVHAARNGPVVTINCHKERCDALIILPQQDDVKHISLLNFTQEKAHSARSKLEGYLRRKGLRERGVKVKPAPGDKDEIASILLTLWSHVVKPVLDFLGLTRDVSTDPLPHITWCPTGAMSFLPLHAAGDYDKPRSRVFDYAISSYTPTITAIFTPTPSTLTRTSRVLTIGQANTPGRTPLPGTAKELEYVKKHAQIRAEYTQLEDNQATITTVLDAMERHDWVHLACHAHQNVHDPTKSGFHLHDGTLDLAAINRRSFKNKGLAFLSACQTATGDEKLPDEAIHLASGMLMAGYPSVIATMWSVVDEDAPLVADKVYAELMKEGKVGNGEAGKALHNAVAELRDKVGERAFARWLPYIHIGS